MARYTGPTNRLARREGVDLGLKTPGTSSHKELLKRLNIVPGQHGYKRRRRRVFSYGQQLREKQKVKRMYGILERQFKRYIDLATTDVKHTGEVLLSTLERRLDNVVYRLNFAPTRTFARQLVNHGHVLVDGIKVDIPSFLMKPGMVISLSEKMLNNSVVKKLLTEENPHIVSWLERKGPVGRMTRNPKRDDIPEHIEEQPIIEFYSR